MTEGNSLHSSASCSIQHVQEKILADLHYQLYEKSVKDAFDRRRRKVRNLRSLQPIFQGSVTGDGEDFKNSATAYLAGLQKLVESDNKLLTGTGAAGADHASPAVAAGKGGVPGTAWEDVMGEIAECLVKLGTVPSGKSPVSSERVVNREYTRKVSALSSTHRL